MDEQALKIWETLFQRALALIDSVNENGTALNDWSFGGGTVLMLRHQHRFSKDIDIFIQDPQYLGFLTPRLSDVVESFTGKYIEHAGFIKLIFDEGEIDFIASAPLTQNPFIKETLFDREIQLETSTEIIAKKLWHRGDQFTARDIFDLATVIEKEPEALTEITPILSERKETITNRITSLSDALREDFNELEALECKRSFDDCVELVSECFNRALRYTQQSTK